MSPVPTAGVPLSVAVPSVLSRKPTPVGRAPVSDKTGFGEPVAVVVVTVNVPAVPTVKVVLFALVIVQGVKSNT